MELLRNHQGLFQVFLSEMGIWDPEGLVKDHQQVLNAYKGCPSTLLVHGNYLPSDTDLGDNTLVYCPRTHAAFGHEPHPFQEFLAKGNRVILGTDSLASNPDLDMLSEVRFLHQKNPIFPVKSFSKWQPFTGPQH